MTVIPDSENPAQPLNRERLTWDQAIELLLACGLSHAFAFRVVRDMFRAGYAAGAEDAQARVDAAECISWSEGREDALAHVAEVLEGYPTALKHLRDMEDIPPTADEPEDQKASS